MAFTDWIYNFWNWWKKPNVIMPPVIVKEPEPEPEISTMMKPSKKCYDIIKHHEQCLLKAYKDIAGVWTIGWGTIQYENGAPVKAGQVIPQFRADQLLEFEVNKKARQVNNFTIDTFLLQCQYDALVSFAYNVGTGALSGSTLLKRVKNNPFDPTIHDAFMMWVKYTDRKTGLKKTAKGLVARRKSESWLYFHNELKYFKE